MGHAIKGIHNLIFQLGIDPGHGYWALVHYLVGYSVENGTMMGFLKGETNIVIPFYFYGFGNQLVIFPPRSRFVRVGIIWVFLFIIKINIIVLEHGKSVGQFSVMPQ